MTEAEIAALIEAVRRAERSETRESTEEIGSFIRALLDPTAKPPPGHLSSEDAAQLVRAIRTERDAE